MKVILLNDVEHLGQEGDIVDVADGYGRNYLIPQQLARLATDGAVRAVKEERRQAARKRAEYKEGAEEVAKELEDELVVIPAKVGEEGRIFGSVTTQQIAVELANRGFDVDRKAIELDEDIRRTGVFTARVELHPEVTADLRIQVISEAGD